MNKGKVYLVGAGPGDPGLITVKGLEAIRKADAIVYDRLASPRLLEAAKPGAEMIYVGKLPDRHTMKQEEINRLLADLALQGKVVTRLKGGDPCVFGRVGEEADLLVEHGIEFDIVPGITSAISVPAYAGIPVTHRDFNTSFTIVTGHEKPEKLDSTIHWDRIAMASDTLIFLMGVAKIGYICEQLIRHGRSADTPVALIRWGTRPEQRTLTGTLETIAEQVERAGFKPPAIIIVGEVVRLRDRLKWYEQKPLFGKRVLITRSSGQAGGLAELIQERGGEAVEMPMLRMADPEGEAAEALDRAIEQIGTYEWLLFTSVNGVEFFFRRLRDRRVDIRKLHRARIGAVGPKTAEALEARGIMSETLPNQYIGEALFEHLKGEILPGMRVLLPRADIASPLLPEKLAQAGADVTEVDAYRTVLATDDAEHLASMLEEGDIHVMTFTSSSTVDHLLELLSRCRPDPLKLLEGVQIACIGPVTAKTAEDRGLAVSCVAQESTVESLVEAIATLKEEQL